MGPKSGRESIREAAHQIRVTDYLSCRDYLACIYHFAKEDQPVYSYIQFALDLGLGKTNMMRLVIIGERPLTVKAGRKIADAADLHGDERRYFTTLVEYEYTRSPAERDRLFAELMEYKSRIVPRELNSLLLSYFDTWYNPVLREMTALKGFEPTPEWIRRHLNFPLHLSEIKSALDTQVQLGILDHDQLTGKYRRSRKKLHSPTSVDSLSLVRYHQKMIEMGRESITRIHESQREVVAQTSCIPVSAVPILREKIKKLLDEMESLEASESDSQVFQMNIQLFPFTKAK